MDALASAYKDKRYTYADYEKWDGKTRYELIDGAAYAMSSPSQAHQEAPDVIPVTVLTGLEIKLAEVFA